MALLVVALLVRGSPVFLEELDEEGSGGEPTDEPTQEPTEVVTEEIGTTPAVTPAVPIAVRIRLDRYSNPSGLLMNGQRCSWLNAKCDPHFKVLHVSTGINGYVHSFTVCLNPRWLSKTTLTLFRVKVVLR